MKKPSSVSAMKKRNATQEQDSVVAAQFEVPDSARMRFGLMGSADRQLLFELDQDPEVMRFINGGKPTSMDDVDNLFLPRMGKYTRPEKGWGIWKAQLLDGGEFLGWILVRPMYFFCDSQATEESNLELGWRFHQSAWGKGYATEAARAIAAALRDQGRCESFAAIAEPENEASINIMKKLGMSFQKQAVHRD